MRVVIPLLVLAILATNLGITWVFNDYVTKVKENQVQLILGTASEQLEDGMLSSDEKTLLRQTSNQVKAVASIRTMDGVVVFDSLIGGSGTRRPLFNSQNVEVDPQSLVYKEFIFISNGVNYTVIIGRVDGWSMDSTEKAFVVAVNLILIAVLAIAMPIVWWVSGRISRRLSEPMLAIGELAERIRKGDYATREMPRSEAVELDRLGESIQALAGQLQIQEELRRRMTTDMAHELRSPLTVLRSQMEGMADGVLEINSERLYRLNDEIMRITKLIDHLNELTRVENDLYKLNLQEIDVPAILGELALNHGPLFEEKGIDLILDLVPMYVVEADQERFKQIMENLLTNALKYTDEGVVTIKLTGDEGGGHLEVSDTGIGISESDLPFIFQRFYRVDPSRSRATGGSGIGLAIVKKLVTAHGWTIEAQSEKGVGTTIRIDI